MPSEPKVISIPSRTLSPQQNGVREYLGRAVQRAAVRDLVLAVVEVHQVPLVVFVLQLEQQ